MEITVKEGIKCLKSDTYNYLFHQKSGVFARWGATEEDDPEFSPYGPEILDLEISAGYCPNNCPHCYKGNMDTKYPETMSLGEFKDILYKMPETLTQIAFGITGVTVNKQFIQILQYTRDNGIVPNFTLTGEDLTDEMAVKIAKYVGGLAVSVHPDKKGYDVVRKFVDLGVTQTNIHLVLSEENYDFVREVFRDAKTDKRLEGLNAIVLLGLKQKGRGVTHHVVKQDRFDSLLDEVFTDRIGFDSCSTNKFEKWLIKRGRYDEFITMVEPCESGLFSAYINVRGEFFPCSFCEGAGEWKNGMNVFKSRNFLTDIWNSDRLIEWRKRLLLYGRKCPMFDVGD